MGRSIGLRQQNARLLTAVCQQRFSAVELCANPRAAKADVSDFQGYGGEGEGQRLLIHIEKSLPPRFRLHFIVQARKPSLRPPASDSQRVGSSAILSS